MNTAPAARGAAGGSGSGGACARNARWLRTLMFSLYADVELTCVRARSGGRLRLGPSHELLAISTGYLAIRPAGAGQLLALTDAYRRLADVLRRLRNRSIPLDAALPQLGQARIAVLAGLQALIDDLAGTA